MSLVTFFLTRHPAVVQTLRDEIATLNSQVPSYTEGQILQYLRCVIRETQRLIPTVATIERSAVRDTWLPTGGGEDLSSLVFVTKGQQVQMQMYAMQHSKTQWGEDVDEFKPEKWTDLEPGWKFAPFGGRRRICPGREFSLWR
jgi:cytochrome P450